MLKEDEIAQGLQTQGVNVFSSLGSMQNVFWLFFFASLAIISLWISFRISFSHWGIGMTKQIEKFRHFGLPIVRMFLGVSLLFSAYHMSLFGPELPLTKLPNPIFWQYALYLSGVMITIGLFSRFVAVLLLILFLLSFAAFGTYMITYINYLGEIIVLLLVGSEGLSIDSLFFSKIKSVTGKIAGYLAVPILRISFALSLLYAALYVKFLHTTLSHDVVINFQLTKYFAFDPLFIVLGAGMIEVVIGLLFLLGLNMRWNIFFFAFWATVSLLFFGESVWPHYILFGISIGLFLYGYDRFTIENTIVTFTKKLLKK